MHSLLILSASVALSQAPAERLAALDRAIAARDKLTPNYRLVVSLSVEHFEPKSEPAKESRGPYRSTVGIWVRGDRVRVDESVREFPDHPEDVGRRNVRCRNCERPGYVLVTSVGSTNSRTMVVFTPLAQYDAADQWRIDWRRLGQLPTMLTQYTQHTPDAVLRHLKQVGRDPVEYAVRDGHRCLVVHSPYGEGTRKTWLRPDLDMNPVLFDDSGLAGGYAQRTEVTYAKFTGADVWFPKTVTVDTTVKGKPDYYEKLVVEQAEFNTPSPDQVFTLAGLGLEDGQAVEFPETKDSGDAPLWRGGKLDKGYTLRQSTIDAMKVTMNQPPVPDAPPSNRAAYLAGAGVLAALAAGAFALARRRSRA